MLKITKNEKNFNVTFFNIILAVLTIAALGAFCYVYDYSLIIPLIVVILGFQLHFMKKASFKMFSNLGLLLFLIILIAHAFKVNSYLSTFPSYYVPVASIGMLTVLLFNDMNLAFIMSFISSIIASIILGGDFNMMLTFFSGSLVGSYFIKDARRRGQIITAGLFVSVTHTVCLFLLSPDVETMLNRAFAINYLYPLAANGFIVAFIIAATLKVFEYLFDVLTNYSLLELSDFNQPLLKRLILEAPGTYHHSLVVSNLAEAAADAIGSNSLLARVGAYYHDIGKMEKPEYFTENQLVGANVHDKIEPSMSRLVILNHVKEGLEIARKNKINHNIVDFIPQHHGTGLVYYFYQKALEEAKQGEVITEDNYRYPGPKPQTKESAIVLMADSVEGATRALDEPTHPKIEETVKKIVNNKFIDGQLDECQLTLKEIDKICSVFTRILTAMYHNRIKYPEKKNGK